MSSASKPTERQATITAPAETPASVVSWSYLRPYRSSASRAPTCDAARMPGEERRGGDGKGTPLGRLHAQGREGAAAVHCEGGGAPHVRRKVGVRLSVLCPLHKPHRPLQLRRHPLLVRRGAGLLPLFEHRGGAQARCTAHVHPGAAVGRGGEWQQQQQQRHEDGARPEEEEEEGDEPTRRHGAEHAESEYGRRHTGSLVR
mmetsp:Transcript_39175/g.123470  ORF Transcript_39175/g.123470 Transcript_39175/m.123470 type:complete len:201 (+) Transcript_39175:1820-2422(+)